MRGHFRATAAFACLVAAIALTTSPATASSNLDRLDPSAASKARAWLADLGLDASDVVIQPGANNYAGPNCPGAGWDCVGPGVPAVQFASTGDNVYDCTTSPCAVTQETDGGSNTVNCNIAVTTATSSVSCSFNQKNTTGPNLINASQSASNSQGILGGEFTQSSAQAVSCDQENGSGTNTVVSNQQSTFSSSATLNHPVTHTQEGTTTFACEQTSNSGAQSAQITQKQAQSSDLIATDVIQKQNNANDGIDLSAVLTQTSNSGAGSAVVDQDEDFDQDASALLGGVLQLQGPGNAGGFNPNPNAGILARLVVDSVSSCATYDVDQNKEWDQTTGTVVGTITQVQDDKLDCCLGLEDFGLTPCTATVDHTSNLSASEADAPQRATHRAKIAAKVNAVYTSTIVFDQDAPITTTKSGPFIQTGKECVHGQGSCADTSESNALLRGSIRRVSPSPQSTFSKRTTGPNNGTYEIRIEFQNFSDQPAPDVRIYWTLPSGFTMVSAAGCQKNGSEIKCQKGTGLPGETKTIFGTIMGKGTRAPGEVLIPMRVTTGAGSTSTSEAYIDIVAVCC